MADYTYETPAEPKKSNTGLIIAIVVVVLLLCCCCLAVGGTLAYLYSEGELGRVLFSLLGV